MQFPVHFLQEKTSCQTLIHFMWFFLFAHQDLLRKIYTSQSIATTMQSVARNRKKKILGIEHSIFWGKLGMKKWQIWQEVNKFNLQRTQPCFVHCAWLFHRIGHEKKIQCIFDHFWPFQPSIKVKTFFCWKISSLYVFSLEPCSRGLHRCPNMRI